MPTNEERRKVAEIMRDGTRFSVSSCVVALRLGLECEEFETCAECESMLADRLADLIEPEAERTCRNEAYLYSPSLLFVCSECTRATDEYEHIPLIGEYCRCGAKRVD